MRKEHKKAKKEIDKFLEKLGNEAFKEGITPFGKEWEELEGEVKRMLLEKAGIDVEDYLYEELSEGNKEAVWDKAHQKLSLTLRKGLTDLFFLGREDMREEEFKRKKQKEEKVELEKEAEPILKEFREKMKRLFKK